MYRHRILGSHYPEVRYLNQSGRDVTVQYPDGWERHVIEELRAQLDQWEAELNGTAGVHAPTIPAPPEEQPNAVQLLQRSASLPGGVRPPLPVAAMLSQPSPRSMVAPPVPNQVPPPIPQSMAGIGAVGALPQPPLRPPPPVPVDPMAVRPATRPAATQRLPVPRRIPPPQTVTAPSNVPGVVIVDDHANEQALQGEEGQEGSVTDILEAKLARMTPEQQQLYREATATLPEGPKLSPPPIPNMSPEPIPQQAVGQPQTP